MECGQKFVATYIQFSFYDHFTQANNSILKRQKLITNTSYCQKLKQSSLPNSNQDQTIKSFEQLSTFRTSKNLFVNTYSNWLFLCLWPIDTPNFIEYMKKFCDWKKKRSKLNKPYEYPLK